MCFTRCLEGRVWESNHAHFLHCRGRQILQRGNCSMNDKRTSGMALSFESSFCVCPLASACGTGIAMWFDTFLKKKKTRLYYFSSGPHTHTQWYDQCKVTYFHVVPVAENLLGGPPSVAACLRHVMADHVWWTLAVHFESQANIKCCIFLPKKEIYSTWHFAVSKKIKKNIKVWFV